MGNDPINNVDPSGGFLELSPLAAIGVKTLGGAILGAGVDAFTGGDGRGMLVGAGAGLLSGVVGSFGFKAVRSGVVLGVGMVIRQNPYASFAGNQTGGRIITTEAVATQSSIVQAIEYVKQSGSLSDIFSQITSGSLGNTDFVFDITVAADAAGHSGIFSISQLTGDFSFEISEYVHNGAVDASQLTADMPLQIKLFFGKYDPRNKTDVGYNIETIAHEMILHIRAMVLIIKFLRSGVPVQSVLDKWYKESQPGGSMNDDKQHIEFAKSDTKIRKLFNSIISRILKGIKNITHRKQLNKAVSDDVNFQKKKYKVK